MEIRELPERSVFFNDTRSFFIIFFRVVGRGTAREICDFMVERGADFKCRPERRHVNVNRQISRQCGRQYPTGIVHRELSADGIYEYFTV